MAGQDNSVGQDNHFYFHEVHGMSDSGGTDPTMIRRGEAQLREFLIGQGWTPPSDGPVLSNEARYAVTASTAEVVAYRAALGTREGLGMGPRADDNVEFHVGDYCEGVRDALRWVTTGQITESIERYVEDKLRGLTRWTDQIGTSTPGQ